MQAAGPDSHWQQTACCAAARAVAATPWPGCVQLPAQITLCTANRRILCVTVQDPDSSALYALASTACSTRSKRMDTGLSLASPERQRI
jgi:hypothetical protein